jgi:hypothetical protein
VHEKYLKGAGDPTVKEDARRLSCGHTQVCFRVSIDLPNNRPILTLFVY